MSKSQILFEGTNEVFEYIQLLFHSGELNELLGQNIPVISKTDVQVNLNNWLKNTFEADWQSFKACVPRREKESDSYAIRIDENLFTKAGLKYIEFMTQLGSKVIVGLYVGIRPEKDGKISMQAKLSPSKGDMYLPTDISLSLVQKSGKVIQEVQSKNEYLFIKLKRHLFPIGVSFNIKVTLNNVSILEDFVIK
jgi:hypothetical protein